MCGIFGILHLDGQPAPSALLTALGAVTRHRGPDDSGIHTDGPCAIGMRRLSIIDLASGHQPLTNEDESLWLVCNGEIYNYHELRRALEPYGHRFRTASDCETLLHAYEQWGDAFILRLNGMFGFALWDARRRRLLVGRDRLGVKPLYVYEDGQRLVFASEAKAILKLPDFTPKVNNAALQAYLQLGYVAAPHSLFAGIRKLPVASLLTVENGRVETRQYWRMPETTDYATSEDEWAERTRCAVELAVRRQMVSDVPIGAFLSGGIDSSAVVGFMAQATQQPVKTYSIGFEGGAAEALYNELPYARRVAELFGTEHHEIIVKPDVVGLLPKLLWHLDEPIADSAFMTTYLVSEFARRDVTVILSGVGGDELFGGYRRYLGNHYAAQFKRLPGWVKQSARTISCHLPSDRHSGVLNKLRLAKAFIASAELPFEERYRTYMQLMSPKLAQRMLTHPATPIENPLLTAFASVQSEDALNRLVTVDWQTQLPDDLLFLTDKMSMAVSLECRVPLLDQDLVDLAAAMPEAVKVRGGRLKHLLKRALSDLLPPDILERPKRGFGMPVGAWLKGELALMLDTVLNPTALRRRGLFEPTAVAELIAAHRTRREDYTDALLALLNFELWAQLYLDGRSATDLADELKAQVQSR
jgi:asparagine synthase (glutamine-hydrolysing)